MGLRGKTGLPKLIKRGPGVRRPLLHGVRNGVVVHSDPSVCFPEIPSRSLPGSRVRARVNGASAPVTVCSHRIGCDFDLVGLESESETGWDTQITNTSDSMNADTFFRNVVVEPAQISAVDIGNFPTELRL